MLDENYNKVLDIYIHDIESCTELQKLNEWENALLKKSGELKIRIKTKKVELSKCFNQQIKGELLLLTDLIANIQYFKRTIHNRIRKLKSQKEFNRNIYYNMLKFFKEIVKEKMTAEEYESIKAEAYRRAEELQKDSGAQ